MMAVGRFFGISWSIICHFTRIVAKFMASLGSKFGIKVLSPGMFLIWAGRGLLTAALLYPFKKHAQRKGQGEATSRRTCRTGSSSRPGAGYSFY